MNKAVFLLIFLSLAFGRKFPTSSDDDPNTSKTVSKSTDEDTILLIGLRWTLSKLQANEFFVACTEIFGYEEEYASECDVGGDLVITCDCHDYICVDENLTLPVYGEDETVMFEAVREWRIRCVQWFLQMVISLLWTVKKTVVHLFNVVAMIISARKLKSVFLLANKLSLKIIKIFKKITTN